MPLRGFGGKSSKWCPICRREVSHTKLTTHLKQLHGLGLVPGCRECWDDYEPYLSSKWNDVTKHIKNTHKHKDSNSNPLRTLWFLAACAPTYRAILSCEVCTFPLKEEKGCPRNMVQVKVMGQCKSTPWLSRPRLRRSKGVEEEERDRSPRNSSPEGEQQDRPTLSSYIKKMSEREERRLSRQKAIEEAEDILSLGPSVAPCGKAGGEPRLRRVSTETLSEDQKSGSPERRSCKGYKEPAKTLTMVTDDEQDKGACGGDEYINMYIGGESERVEAEDISTSTSDKS